MDDPIGTIGIGRYVRFFISTVIANDEESMRQAVEMCNERANIILDSGDTITSQLCLCSGAIPYEVSLREVQDDLRLHEIVDSRSGGNKTPNVRVQGPAAALCGRSPATKGSATPSA